MDLADIFFRHSDHMHDDASRQRISEVFDQFDLIVIDEAIDGPMNHRFDLRAHRFEGARREALVKQLTQTGVIGWVLENHPLSQQAT